MAVTTRDQFLEVLASSRLLAAAQFDVVSRSQIGGDDPKSLARYIVQQGWLTRWQAQQLLAGRTKFFLGRYKLLQSLGQGGMGTVLKAEQPGLNRVVALKVMSREVLRNPDAVARFLREIRSAAALDHPNIVRAYDADCVGKTYFLVMEYVEGEDLKAWIRQHRRLPIPWACEVIRQAALGLGHAHAHGMVHRDLKPANLLIVADDQAAVPLVKILDMGLAKFVSSTQEEGGLTRTGQIMGTPDYMAPEQAQNTRDADIRADIYALGVTLFEMLTGQLPFGGNSPLEKLMLRIQQDAPRVQSLRPDVPAELDALVAQMLARDPGQRVETPAEVAAALTPFSLGTMAAVIVPTVLTLESVGTPARPEVEARVDTSLNGFLNALATEAEDRSTPSPDPPTNRAQSSARGTRKPQRVGAGKLLVGIGAALLVVLIAGNLSFSSRVRTPPPQSPTIAEEIVAGPNDGPLESSGQPPQIDVQSSRTPTAPTTPASTPLPLDRAVSLKATLRKALPDSTTSYLVVSPDGKLLADRHRGSKSIRLWNLETGARTQTWSTSVDSYRALAFLAPPFLASGEGSSLVLLNMLDGTKFPAVKYHAGTIATLPWSSDGTLATCGGQGDATVRLRLGEKPGQEIGNHGRGAGSFASCVAIAPNGKLVASGGNDHRVRLYDIGLAKETFALDAASIVHTVAFSPDSKLLASGARGTPTGPGSYAGSVKLWDVSTGALRRSLTGFTYIVHGLAFSPDGRLLAAAQEFGSGPVRVFDLVAGGEPLVIDEAQAGSVAFLPTGHTLVAGGEKTGIQLWDIDVPQRDTAAGEADVGEIDLLAMSDPTTDRAWGSWRRTAEGFVSGGGKDATDKLQPPVEFTGDYDLRVTLRASGAGSAAAVGFPVGSVHATLFCRQLPGNKIDSGLEKVGGLYWSQTQNPTRAERKGVDLSRPHTFDVRVRLTGEQARIAVELDGERLSAWEGPIAALSTHPRWQVRANRFSLGAATADPTDSIVFQRAILKPRDATVKLLRPE